MSPLWPPGTRRTISLAILFIFLFRLQLAKSSRSLGQRGLCRYGNTIGCCYGWKRSKTGRCQPTCSKPCEHGTCTGANQCTCDKGYAGVTCSKDYNECGDNVCQHRCMNTEGSYRCYCRRGYTLQPDGHACQYDNSCEARRCQYGCIQEGWKLRCNCPDGLELHSNGRTCVDIDECSALRNPCPRRRRCMNSFGSFMCLCDHGFSYQYIDGRLRCRDVDECQDGTNDCHASATCYNTEGSFSCFCNGEFFGDGKTCYSLDPRRCDDKPCSPLTTCRDVRGNEVENAADGGSVKLFQCGPCPAGYSGDGETCDKATEDVVVVVVDKSQPDVPVEGTNIQVYNQADVFSVGITSPDGFATVSIPAGTMVIVSASKPGYMDTTMTYQVVVGHKNVITLYMEFPSRLGLQTEFIYDNRVSRALEFTVDDQMYEFILPEGSLNVGQGQPVKASFVTANLQNNEMDGAPELVALARESSNDAFIRGLQNFNLEAYALFALRLENVLTRDEISLLLPMTVRVPLSKSDSLDGETSVPAWFYNRDEGVYIQDGEGRLTSQDGGNGGKIWSYSTRRSSWLAAAKPWSQTHCVEVKVCRDENCQRVEPNAAVWLNGLDFHYSTFRRTNAEGSACFHFKQNGRVRVHSCFGGDQITVTGTGNPSACDAGGQWQNTVVGGGAACQEVTILYQESEVVNCGEPGIPDEGVKLGNVYSFGANVTFTCKTGYEILGNSQRICHSCGQWSGSQPVCYPSDSDKGSGDGVSLNFF